jgi:hypothetical protein
LDKEWPQLIQQGTRDHLLTGLRSSLDTNPRNLIWLPQSEVEILRSQGVPIEREGFFLMEFAFAATNMTHLRSWETFQNEFRRAMIQFK